MTNEDSNIEGKFEQFMHLINREMETCFALKLRMAIHMGEVNWYHDNLTDMKQRLHTLYSVNKYNPTLITYKDRYRKEIIRTKKSL